MRRQLPSVVPRVEKYGREKSADPRARAPAPGVLRSIGPDSRDDETRRTGRPRVWAADPPPRHRVAGRPRATYEPATAARHIPRLRSEARQALCSRERVVIGPSWAALPQ